MSVGKIFKFHNDLDTDQIIASQYLLLPTIDEMKDHTFESLDPDFPKKVKPGDYVVGGENFGCGSSREHAVWGLEKRGIKCLIGSSFAGIFFDNCANNGVLAIVLPKDTVSALIQELQNSESKNVTVDLEAQTVTTPSGAVLHFELEPSRKEKLLQGLDPVALTLKSEEKIKNFEDEYFKKFPWLA